MDKDAREDKLLAIIGLLSAALVTLMLVYLATWFTASSVAAPAMVDTDLCQPTSPQPSITTRRGLALLP